MAKVLGWYNHLNVGDEAYKLAFPKLKPENTFEFLNNIPDGTSCGSFILGGGDILSPIYLHGASKVRASRKLIISASATSATPIELLRQFDSIFVRDAFSVNFLKSCGIESSYMPDISFSLTPSVSAGRTLIESYFKTEKLDLRKKRIGVVINAYLSDPGSHDAFARDFLVFHKFAYDLSRVFDNTDASFVFFPMCTSTPADDRVTNGILANRCKYWNKNLVIYDRLGVQDTLNMISSFDMVVSSRLHSSIFSVISKIPFIDITHHDKARNFLDTVSLQSFGMPYWELSPKHFAETLNSIMNDSNTYREMVSSAYQKQMDVLQQEVKNVHLFE